jgi:predicted Zn-ribbon and HTH transcriptional regulator
MKCGLGNTVFVITRSLYLLAYIKLLLHAANTGHLRLILFTVDGNILFQGKHNVLFRKADPIGRAVLRVSLRPLACKDCGFEYRRWQGCLSLVSVVGCQVEVSATS